jgi:hypothetical protein
LWLKNAVAAPGAGVIDLVHECAVPAEVAFEAADPSFTAGPPLHKSAKRPSSLEGSSRGAGFALSRGDHGEISIDRSDFIFGVATAASEIGGDVAGALVHLASPISQHPQTAF